MGKTSATFFDDGSVDVVCVQCGKLENLSSDNKNAIRLNQIEGAYQTYTCLNCWKENQNKEKTKEKEIRENQIEFGQTYNLAVQAVLNSGLTPSDGKKFWDKISEYQSQFLADIKGRKLIKQNESIS